MVGENGTLFDMEEFEAEGKERKQPQTEAEKRLERIKQMEDRDFRNFENKLNSGKSLTASEAKRLEEYRRKYEQEAGADLPEHFVTSKVAVAAHFGVTKKTVINWAHRDKPMPQLPNGSIISVIVISWKKF